MSKLQRFALRLRQQALRWYEIVLCATLLALALAVAAPSSAHDGEEAAVQCGNIQSSTVVMQR
jgi:hypothetical protein